MDARTEKYEEYEVTFTPRGKYVAISAECKRCHERADVDVNDCGELEFDHECEGQP